MKSRRAQLWSQTSSIGAKIFYTNRRRKPYLGNGTTALSEEYGLLDDFSGYLKVGNIPETMGLVVFEECLLALCSDYRLFFASMNFRLSDGLYTILCLSSSSSWSIQIAISCK